MNIFLLFESFSTNKKNPSITPIFSKIKNSNILQYYNLIFSHHVSLRFFVQIWKKPGILLERIGDFSPQYGAYLQNCEGLHLPMPKGPKFSPSQPLFLFIHSYWSASKKSPLMGLINCNPIPLHSNITPCISPNY